MKAKALFLPLLLVGCASAPKSQSLPISAYINLGNQRLELEVAKTSEQQNIGLMNRFSLEPNRGMLFPINPPQDMTFWMKDTKIPLDIIFIRNGQIQRIVTAQPCLANPCPKYSAGEVVDQVVEIGSGRSAELGLRTGQFLKFEAK